MSQEALKQYNPVTSSMRGLVRVNRSELWSGRPFKKLTVGKINTGGRNNYGRITSRHIGGGAKKLYRMIDFRRSKQNVIATVVQLEYDPNRSAFIALLKYEDGAMSYIIAPKGIAVGDKLESGPNADIAVGNALPLKLIPIGSVIHNIELQPGKGGQMARSAGGSAELRGKNDGYAQIKLPSGRTRLINLDCYATIGQASNLDHKNIVHAKAGRVRNLGRRPTVRGVAMNPVDHPHGGGEGKTSGGRHPVTPWGKPTKGKKTRNCKRTNKYIIKIGK